MLFSISKVVLEVATSSGIFGASIDLRDGLNVIKAPNTHGKSTCLQAVLYGLGLERMLGPRVETPFGHALKEYIKERPDGPAFTVQSSFVALELINSRQERLAVQREIKGEVDQRLVSAKLTDAQGIETRRDFFLHDPGSAQREDGFHHFLASFIGWHLPEVSTFDGREVPLYLAAIFPMLFVEQKRGWSAIQGPFPTFLKIQDISRRAMEFLLNLDVGERRRQRQEVEKKIGSLEGEWASIRQHLISRLGNLSRLQNIPETPEQTLLRRHVSRENTLDSLKNEHPTLWERAWQTINAEESRLEMLGAAGASAPAVRLEESLNRIENGLKRDLPHVAQATVNEISAGTLSDWLMRCPLDFEDE